MLVPPLQQVQPMTPQNLDSHDLDSPSAIDVADRLSRRRALGVTLAAVAFLGVEIVVRPVFRTDGYASSGWRAYAWPFNAALLLCMLLPIGGLIWGRQVRALVNDEVSRANARTAAAAGFWTAMVIALGIYVAPGAAAFTAREAIFLIVTPTTGVALLLFAWLEARAHRDG
jgi:hypothetical protein